MAMLEQTVARQQTTALMVIACETLQDTAGVLKESQREMLLLDAGGKGETVLAPRMVLTQGQRLRPGGDSQRRERAVACHHIRSASAHCH